ncbi:3-ketoacyl-ACP reductase [Arenibacter sp. F26102]|uniref:3-ketoacyl-ACP reductase n=1 Tax=Arenibacter sp. F26102 TaxID=2926416 RepID=UPI001FF3B68F|nr:3-ketoacyl-ACP reductase [Arenibacter sp. F26102]MCK0148040.1 3-ketoacyl-ACP reductase [Arenibacter sp. F26102]
MKTKKSALVTGGSRGIGFSISKYLAKAGFNIAVNGMRHEEEVQSVLEELRDLGVEVLYCRGNLGNSEDRLRIIQQIKNNFGQLNILVNNAGVAPLERNDVLETTEESFDRVLGINLKGTFFMTQMVSQWMIAQRKIDSGFQGCIINISSVSATMASINRGEYCISKAGLAMVTQLFAVRLGDFDIPVYEVRPGIIETDMTAGVKAKYDKLFEEGIALQRRWGQPSDVGKVVASLAKGDFLYSTGQVILVDGGLSMGRL